MASFRMSNNPALLLVAVRRLNNYLRFSVMTIALDIITKKKLILVRQLYQRAVIQADANHSYVDRIMALIGFDLSNETILKAVIGAVSPSLTPKSSFQEIVTQADGVVLAAALPGVPDKIQIQHIRTLRNDAQHKAKYPNDTDVSDCRTHTRDFLKKVINNVWGEDFDALSLTDIINDAKVKGYLVGAESDLKAGAFTETVIKSVAGLQWTLGRVRESILGRVSPWVDGIVVTETFKPDHKSVEVFRAFQHMRDLLMSTIIGLNFQAHLRYKKITKSVVVMSFMGDGNYSCNLLGYIPTKHEAEFVAEFAVNAVIQIESLVGDINQPFDI